MLNIKLLFLIIILSFILLLKLSINKYYSYLQNNASIQINVLYPHSKLQKNDQLFLKGHGSCQDFDQQNGILLQQNQEDYNLWQITLENCQTQLDISFKIYLNNQLPQLGAENIIENLQNNQQITVYPYFKQIEGTFMKINEIYSDFFNNYRDMIIYLPPGYEENNLSVFSNVLLMTDGQRIFTPQEFDDYFAIQTENNSTKLKQGFDFWEMEKVLNEKIIEGSMEQLIVCGIFNTKDRTDEYTYIPDPKMDGGFADEFLNFVEDKIFKIIQNKLRVNNNNKYGLMGASLGGLLSCYAGVTRNDIYIKTAGISSSFWWDNQNFYNQLLPLYQNNIKENQIIYIDQGTLEGQKNLNYFLQVESFFINIPQLISGINFFSYIIEDGYHSDYSWKQRPDKPLLALYSPQPLKQE